MSNMSDDDEEYEYDYGSDAGVYFFGMLRALRFIKHHVHHVSTCYA
mgnify:CR=1 FL=1